MASSSSAAHRFRKWIREKDWDATFPYSTPRVTIIQDARLGIARLVFYALIFGYIVGYVMLSERGYTSAESPIGTARMSILEGQDGADWYCGVSEESPAVVEALSSLPYCLQNVTGATTGNIKVYEGDYKYYTLPCINWDGGSSTPQGALENSMLVTTRLTETYETQGCDPLADACTSPYSEVSEQKYFVANIEEYTLGIRHTVQAPSAFRDALRNDPFYFDDPNARGRRGIAGSSTNLNGILEGPNGEELCSFDNEDDGFPDIISLKKLLENTHIQENGLESDWSSSTARYDGLVVLLTIRYSNFQSPTSSLGDIMYTYSASLIPSMTAKDLDTVWVAYPTQRYNLNRHGIQVVVIQTGEIRSFDLQTLLVNSVAALALLNLVSMVIDVFAFRVLASKKQYSSHKFDVVENYKNLHGDGDILNHEDIPDSSGTVQSSHPVHLSSHKFHSQSRSFVELSLPPQNSRRNLSSRVPPTSSPLSSASIPSIE